MGKRDGYIPNNKYTREAEYFKRYYRTMTKQQLIETARILLAEARKREREMAKVGLLGKSPAARYWDEHTNAKYLNNFKKLSRNQMLNTLKETQTFLDAKTGTVAGTRKYWEWLENATKTQVTSLEARDKIGELIGYLRKYTPDLTYGGFESGDVIATFFSAPRKIQEFMPEGKVAEMEDTLQWLQETIGFEAPEYKSIKERIEKDDVEWSPDMVWNVGKNGW